MTQSLSCLSQSPAVTFISHLVTISSIAQRYSLWRDPLLEKDTWEYKQINWRTEYKVKSDSTPRFEKNMTQIAPLHHKIQLALCVKLHESRTPGLALAGAREQRHRGPGSVRFHIWAADSQGGFSGLCRGTGSSRTGLLRWMWRPETDTFAAMKAFWPMTLLKKTLPALCVIFKPLI